MEHVRGCAYCDGALSGVPAARSGAGPARVLLPASALNAAGLSAGELVLLAVVQLPDDDSAATSTPGSARGRQGSASATPPRTPPSGSRGDAKPRLHVDAEASPLLLARVSEPGVAAHSAGAVSLQAASQAAGERLLAVCVWPSQQLATGAASASAAVLDAASWPPAGAALRVYPFAVPGSRQGVRACVLECSALTLTLCEADGSDISTLPDAVPGSPLTPQASRGASASKAAVPFGTPANKASASKSAALRCALVLLTFMCAC